MARAFDPFLRQSTVLSRRAALGRVMNVTQETWRLTDDPREAAPQTESLATGRTAQEAADIARDMALAMPRHGFHKASGAWWGADATHFHRFVIHTRARRQRAAPLLIASGLAAIALGRMLGARTSKRARPGA